MTKPHRVTLPKLYAILDADLLSRRNISLETFSRDLYAAGIRCMQYRDKAAPSAKLLAAARMLRASLPDDVLLFLNDRADICALSNCAGLHIGQEDLSPAGARRVIGTGPLLGISTHNESQIAIANEADVDYIAIGPVFATTSKANPDPVIGLEGVRRARRLTSKPLVAIGGITQSNARSVIEAGADSIAVISALVPNDQNGSTHKLAEDFLNFFL
ncbi:MAG TPA: thiamine phosphate synthase [Acidobacteriaceae bacterium]|nr:thiamine phosphate synthase [Acidobacteriaceae bacterium]